MQILVNAVSVPNTVKRKASLHEHFTAIWVTSVAFRINSIKNDISQKMSLELTMAQQDTVQTPASYLMKTVMKLSVNGHVTT